MLKGKIKIKTRKIICILLACAVVFSSLSACRKKDKKDDNLLDKDSPVTITVWHYYNGIQQTQFDEMVKEFNNTVGSEQGIIVEAFSKNSVGELSNNV